MKHLKGYFDNFEADKLNPLFDQLYQDGWTVSEGELVDSFGTRWNFRDIDHFVYFSRQVFSVIVEGYKIFLELSEDKSLDESSDIQEKLDSANSKIMLLEEQNSIFKKELDIKRKELADLKSSLKLQKPSKTEVLVESPKPKASTKEYIALKRRKYVKIE
jgi:hypothetical protein